MPITVKMLSLKDTQNMVPFEGTEIIPVNNSH